MGGFTTKVDQAGRIIIPAPVRRRLGLQPGSEVVLSLTGDRLTLWTRQQALHRAQKYFRRLAPAGELWSEELLADRQREAEFERGS
ncbi:MAG: AbrB/MazE/SpoVT family DNA-binding domain-containing protein [Bryobacteraceae bacterium]